MKWVIPCLLLITGTAYSRSDLAWDPVSSPETMNPYYEKKMSLLPLKGKVKSKTRYWSGDYWALNKGNINFRWNARNKTGFDLHSPTKERAFRMSIPELAELSPTEKYDLFTGRYDYPLRNEVSKIADKNAASWEGICHGWSPASMNHDEPTPKLMRNPDGLEIPFGSTDIKALVSYYYAYVHKAPDTHQMGKRCFKKAFLNREKDCHDDMNAGAFHIVLANRLGIEGKGFIADLQRFVEVWNHPITAYQSKVLRKTVPDKSAAPGTSQQWEVKTVITYVDENGNDWQTVIGTEKQSTQELTYQYKLDLNAEGEIIGGEWISKQRPDFLWVMAPPREFVGVLSRLEELLD